MSETPQANLEIRLFGFFQVSVNGQLVDERSWQRRKAKTLVKILALQPNRQINREQLAEMLSPNLDTTASLNNLNKNLHAARRVLEPDLKRVADSQFILTQGQQIVLQASHLRIDVSEFECHADEALKNRSSEAFESALALYTDDLLLEDLYEDWLTTKRERLRLLRKRLVSQLAALYESQKRFDLAIHYLNLLVGIDGTDEEAHRRLMRVYATAADKSLALRQYKVCAENLRELLDVKPDSETEALYQQILSGKFPTPVSKVSPPTIEPLPLTQAPVGKAGQDNEEMPKNATALIPRSESTIKQNSANPLARLFQARYLVPLSLVLLMLISAGVLKNRLQNKPIESLMVLPCENATGDETLDYLTDGISESLIRNLSQLPDLRVIARHTSFQFKGKAVEPRQVCVELQVGAVLSSKIFERNGLTFITFELFEATKGEIVWTESRQLVADDVYNLERQIETSLVKMLRPKLTEDTTVVNQAHIISAPAYAAYLKGLYFFNRRTMSGDIKKSVDHFQEATDLDPLFALAYAGLANAYMFGGGVQQPPASFMPRAKFCAQKALELDEHIAEAHTSLAFIAEYYEWDFATAEKEYRRAVELNPNYATAHHWYGEFLAFMGNHDEAIKQILKAQELDPLSRPILLDVGVVYHYARQYDKAIEQFQKLLAVDDSLEQMQGWLMLVYFENRQPELAIQAYQQLQNLSNLNARDTSAYSTRGYFYALSGNRKMALQEIEKLKTVDPKQNPEWAIAQLLAILNEKDEAFKWLDIAYEKRIGAMISLKTNAFFDNLRSDPRFAKLLKRIGLIA